MLKRRGFLGGLLGTAVATQTDAVELKSFVSPIELSNTYPDGGPSTGHPSDYKINQVTDLTTRLAKFKAMRKLNLPWWIDEQSTEGMYDHVGTAAHLHYESFKSLSPVMRHAFRSNKIKQKSVDLRERSLVLQLNRAIFQQIE